jgi:hypothetical protein
MQLTVTPCVAVSSALAQADQPVLGRQVGGLVDRGHQAVHRGNVDDAAPAALAHARQHRLHDVEGRGQVDGEDRVPALDREVLDRAGVLDAGVVDHDVDRPERARGRVDQAGGLVGAGQVGLHVGAARAAGLGQLRGNRLALRRRFDAVHDDMGAGLRHRLGDGQADALGGAGNQCGAAFQHGFSPWLSSSRRAVFSTLP